jgi:hypothetical protein
MAPYVLPTALDREATELYIAAWLPLQTHDAMAVP